LQVVVKIVTSHVPERPCRNSRFSA